MSEIPGLPADVFFGSAEDSPPEDWRAAIVDTDDPHAADDPDDNSAFLRSVYGYAPEWFDELADAEAEQQSQAVPFSADDPQPGSGNSPILQQALTANETVALAVRKRLARLLGKD